MPSLSNCRAWPGAYNLFDTEPGRLAPAFQRVLTRGATVDLDVIHTWRAVTDPDACALDGDVGVFQSLEGDERYQFAWGVREVRLRDYRERMNYTHFMRAWPSTRQIPAGWVIALDEDAPLCVLDFAVNHSESPVGLIQGVHAETDADGITLRSMWRTVRDYHAEFPDDVVVRHPWSSACPVTGRYPSMAEILPDALRWAQPVIDRSMSAFMYRTFDPNAGPETPVSYFRGQPAPRSTASRPRVTLPKSIHSVPLPLP